MRSSVSVILSDPAPDTTMAFPDYQQTCTDHARLLILITRIGHQISEETFSKVSTFIRQVEEVPVSDKHGLTRNIGVRYTHQYPIENNDWGEFQAHRRIVGVVSVGSCSSQVELNELCRLHESVKNKFVTTLFDSRCVVLCAGGDKNGAETEEDDEEADEEEADRNEAELQEVDKPPSWFQPQNHKTRLLQFHGSKFSGGLKADIQDFVASLFWILESKRVEWSREGGERSTLLCAPFERKDFVGLDMESRNNRKRILGRQKKYLGDLCLLAGLPAEAWNYYQVGSDILRPANDWLWLAGCLEGLCAVSMVLRDRQEKGTSMGASGLTWEEIIEKYRECVNHYAKYKHAGIIETEASLKAVMILIQNKSFLLASEFLQNIVFINLQISDDEKIERYITLSNLYSQIGFRRKAAFFRRVAAMRCVAPQNPQHDWGACYCLMLESVKGYNLDLGSAAPPTSGWPTLQVQLLQELVGTSRKMGAHSASTRHMAFLFQCMYAWLSNHERQDFATQLSVLSQRAQSTQLPLNLDSFQFNNKHSLPITEGRGVVLPPVNLTCLPKVTSFIASPLLGSLAPHPCTTTESTVSGPFLFTPILNLGAGSARSSGRVKPRPVTWVEGDPAQVHLEVHNSLGVDVKISNLSLVTEGAELEVGPSSLLLHSTEQKQTVIVGVVPRSSGPLCILGYTHSVLGVLSTNLLSHIPSLQLDNIKVDVISPLPILDLHCEGEEALLETGSAEDNWVRTESLTLYSGETRTMRLVVNNVGSVPALAINLQCISEDGVGPELEFDNRLVDNFLPLQPGCSCSLSFKVRGTNNQNFRAEDCLSVTGSESRWSASGFNSLQSRMSHPQSLPSHLSVPPGSGNPSLVSHHSENPEAENSVVRLKAEVRGGQWCRRSECSLAVSQLPSISVSRWDILGGEKVENCFLVLDLINRTGEEMELTYAGRKQLQIEAGDMCRVPLPVEKCSFSESLNWKEGGDEVMEYMEKRVHLVWALGEGRRRRTGEASLTGVVWTDCMLEQLRRPPLTVSVCINGEECSEGRDMEGRLGQLLEVEVRLENSLLEPVSDSRVLVRLEQENTVGLAAVGSTGSTGLYRPDELGSGEACVHSCSLLPLSAGQYSLLVSISLQFRGRIYSWRLSNLNVNVTV